MNKFSPALKRMVRSKTFSIPTSTKCSYVSGFQNSVNIVQTCRVRFLSGGSELGAYDAEGVCVHSFENNLTVSKTLVQVSLKFVDNTDALMI